ncbi:MAG: hypothetical protein CVU03_11425 [Bacteroidetes bacterium HGW-Bacteroidetes-2]|jgi:DNA-directed RNA polymerase beta' subunit|nr:MAG: hypothetical protein CVU03_11425 [Bacteroidetes bacterium HGW-Bacteroidetes-2]
MKKISSISIILFLFCLTIQAQTDKHEKIKALKIAFITQELNLSSADAEKFWPVYNNFEQRKHDLKRKEWDEIKNKMEHVDTMNNEDAKSLLEKMEFYRNEENRLETELIKKLGEQLQPNQIIKLKKAEHDFRTQMLKKYRGEKK